MQNVVDVACSSPPVAMNATKPAAQAVQATDQVSFGLMLQKASERIVNDKQSDRAGKSSDSKPTDNTSGSDSAARKKVDEPKNEREVKQTTKAEKAEKPEKTDKSEKTEKSEDDDKSSKKEAVADTSNMAFGYVTPDITIAETPEKSEGISVETSGEMVAEAVQPANLTQISSTSDAQTGTDKSTLPVTTEPAAITESADQGAAAAGQTAVAATTDAGTNESQQPTVETNNATTFSETLKTGEKIGDGKNDGLKSTSADTKELTANDEQNKVTANTNGVRQDAASVAGKYQEVATSVNASVVKTDKPVVDNSNPQTSPPDTPDGTASVTVQTASQISEPARLAEAPKNEVINQVANQVDQMVKTNRSSLRMQLYPEELGHIDLRIVTTKDGISVTMVTEKASTQQVLKSDMDMLKQNIEQAGIQLSNLNINQGQNSNKQQAFEHRQNFSNNSYPGSSSDNSNSSSNEPKKHLTASVVDYKA